MDKEIFLHMLARIETLTADLAVLRETPRKPAVDSLQGLFHVVKEIREIAHRYPGNKIVAIKELRNQYSVGLKEAKDWVELFDQEGC